MAKGTKEALPDKELLMRAKSLDDPGAVEELFHAYQDLLRSLAYKYKSTLLAYEDAYQVAALGLLKALERFDPGRGTAFITFAYPTITGELKKHYRDHMEVVRIPRRIRDLKRMIVVAQDSLRESLKREPTIPEVAASLDVPEEELIEALAAARRTTVLSLDLEVEGEEGSDSLLYFLGHQDTSYEYLENRMLIEQMMGSLPDDLREIMGLRLAGWTQKKIAERLGISQMEVSRLQKKAVCMIGESRHLEGTGLDPGMTRPRSHEVRGAATISA
ncbi:MAG: sigma-70 family RNA polymerase sigma factor [Actinobacteria bacterium]|nr:sigma-70 family RNA polymerase sigma factor [Actinomycetota bacterium]